jgi:hypothetical protein
MHGATHTHTHHTAPDAIALHGRVHEAHQQAVVVKQRGHL